MKITKYIVAVAIVAGCATPKHFTDQVAPPMPQAIIQSSVSRAQPLVVILPLPPTGYIRLPAPTNQVIGMEELTWDQSTDTTVVAYEVCSAHEVNTGWQGWNPIIETAGTNCAVTNHLNREFFQVLAVGSNGIRSELVLLK